jgi:mannose-1-phosphate guanylyltransferase
MTNGGNTWALVLAAGEGSRLRQLTTTTAGVSVPKQFCSLHGGPSLLHEALQRAETIAAREHVCTVVAEQHQFWWRGALRSMPATNIIVQPRNCGTANGILLPLLHIVERDPDARLVLLPSDHYVRDEAVLGRSLEQALARLNRHKRAVILLGFEPDDVDPELGYIVPGDDAGDGVSSVARFVEKPTVESAQELIFEGALWNAFIVVARAQTLLDLFRMRMPEIVAAMCATVAHDCSDPSRPIAASRLYRSLPDIDFSRHVMQGCESMLRVMKVPTCGWSDLGTPSRVAQALGRAPRWDGSHRECIFPLSGHLNLAAQHARIQASFS